MPDVNIQFNDDEPIAVRCFPKNAHLVLKLGHISLYFAASLLPVVRDEITSCLKKIAKGKT